MADPTLLVAKSLLAGRRSIRRYAETLIAPAVVNELLSLATSAPSAHNRQPWRFAVLIEQSQKRALATAMGGRLRRDRLGDGDAPAVIDADVSRSYARITAAPVVIVVSMTLEDMDRYPDAKRRDAEIQMATQSTAMAVQNLLLAAHAAGLGACWMCAPLFCSDMVRDSMELPAEWTPQALVTLGYPAEAGKLRPRRPLHEVVRYVSARS